MADPAVYPHFDVYPGVVGDVKIMASDPPNTGIYSLNGAPTSYPNLVICERNNVPLGYPLYHVRGLDPVVYPHFDLYPKALQVDEILKQMEVDVKLVNSYLAAEYPNMTVCEKIHFYILTNADIHERPGCISLPGCIPCTGLGVYCKNELFALTHEIMIRGCELQVYLGVCHSDC